MKKQPINLFYICRVLLLTSKNEKPIFNQAFHDNPGFGFSEPLNAFRCTLKASSSDLYLKLISSFPYRSHTTLRVAEV